MKTYQGVEVQHHAFLTSALDGVTSGQLHCLNSINNQFENNVLRVLKQALR
jgi:hypothetical protein